MGGACKTQADRAKTPRRIKRGPNFAACGRAEQKKIAKFRSPCGRRERRIEFSHGLQELRTKLFAHFHTGHPLTIAQNVLASLNHIIAYSSIEGFGGHGRIQF